MSRHYVLACGGRDFHDYEVVVEVMTFMLQFYGKELRVLHGGAPGADTCADRFCAANEITTRVFPADWDGPCRSVCDPGHRRRRGTGTYCPAAGPYRNIDMAEYLDHCKRGGHTTEVLAFPGGAGTIHMIQEAALRGHTINPIDWAPS